MFRSNNYLPLLTLILVIFFAAFFFVRLTETTPVVNDTMGYVYAGQRLAAGDGLTYEDQNNLTYGPFFNLYAFQIEGPDDSRLNFSFPPGLPLLLSLGIKLTGEVGAIYFIVPLLAVVGIAVTCLLGYLLSGQIWVGVISALIIALVPADYWEFGTAAWAGIPSIVFTVAGVCLFLFARKRDAVDKLRIWLPILGGLFLVFSMFIRYSNIVILPALAIYDLVESKGRIVFQRSKWSIYLVLILGLGSILLFNHYYYGGALLTGYSPIHGWYPHPPFSLNYAFTKSFVSGVSLPAAINTLWLNFTILLLLVPAGWFLLPRPSGLFTASATLATLALYSVYAFDATGINARFLLPMFPFAAVSVAAVITALGGKLPNNTWRWIVGIGLLLLIVWPIPDRIDNLQDRNESGNRIKEITRELTAWTEPDAVFLSYGHNDFIAVYGDRSVLDYRHLPESDGEERRYRLEMYPPCLVNTIDGLLLEGKQVFLAGYTTTTPWDTLSILEGYFQLKHVWDEPPTLQVTGIQMNEQREDLGPCTK
jgi:hypothetical protein